MGKQSQPKPKHVPMRTCIATGKKLPKKDMIRLVRLDDKDTGKVSVEVDAKGKARGRGANIEMDINSFDLAIKKDAVKRALKLEKSLTPGEIAELRQNFAAAIAERQFRPGNKKVALKVSHSELSQKLSEAD